MATDQGQQIKQQSGSAGRGKPGSKLRTTVGRMEAAAAGQGECPRSTCDAVTSMILVSITAGAGKAAHARSIKVIAKIVLGIAHSR